MAAPATTQRQTPEGARLLNGFRSMIAFSLDPDVSMWETIDGGITPPGLTVGDAVRTSTMHNNEYHTKKARFLKEQKDVTFQFAYDTKFMTQIDDLVGDDSGSITLHYPDDSTLDFYGYLGDVDFDPLVDGEMPTGTATIVLTAWDPVNHVEAGWVLTEGTGTY